MLIYNTPAAPAASRGRTALSAAIVAALSVAWSGAVLADAELDQLKQQVQVLQKKIDDLSAQQSAATTGIKVEKAAPGAPASGSLSAWGITLYGIIDIGLQWQSNGAPVSDYFPAGSEAVLQKNSRMQIFSLVPSALGQSRIGLQGKEPLLADWSGIFKVETFFNPTSGNISDALKSQTLNNGRSLTQQTTNVDSSIAGELFNGAAYAGISHPMFGTLTFGRQNTLLADGVAKYDPLNASNAFSLIGFSGTTAGGGVTENRRLDNSGKYYAQWGPAHFGALYQWNGSSGTAGGAYQFLLGANGGNGSFDLFYTHKEQAIATAPLSACQLYGAAAVAPEPCTSPGLAALGLSPSNTLAGTVSDNTAYAFMGSYVFQPVKVYLGYEYIEFKNPANPLVAPATAPGAFPQTIGGYVLGFTNNNAYAHHKVLQVYWTGLKWTINPSADFTFAYYGYHQNAYGTGANAGCSTTKSGTCAGNLHMFSGVFDYHFTKRFDSYFGVMWMEVQDGLANGYLEKNTIDPTLGVRYSF